VIEQALLRYREEFPTLATSVHLVSHSLGAMPRSARARASEFLDLWESDAIEAWRTWVPAMRGLANVIADVVGASHESIALADTVSTIAARVASTLEFKGDRRKVVYSAQEFSTCHYVWSATERAGADVVIAESEEAMLAAIDERTLIVPISHVLFRSSTIVDITAIVRRAREVGALVFLDCYQSAGTVPIDLTGWDIDLACGGSVKWTCGGPGTAWLYVRPSLLPTLRPAATGWFAHAEPFAFELGEMRYAEDISRMGGGTPNVPAGYTSRAGWELIREIGVDRIRAKSLRQTRLLRSLLTDVVFGTPEEDARRGGTLCFTFEGDRAVSERLLERRFFHDWRPGCGLRVSPHFYTTDDELRAFVDELERHRR